MTKATLRLPEPSWCRAKIRRVGEGTSLQGVLLTAFQAHLEAARKTGR